VILPIGDSPNPRGVPWLNWTLIALNVLVFVGLFPLTLQTPAPDDPALVAYVDTIAREHDLGRRDVAALLQQVTRYDLVIYRYGFRPEDPGLVNLLAAMFLHAGVAHLAGNMLFLWIFGDNVEHRLGRIGYLVAYLGTGVAAAFGDAWIRAGSGIPSVGASGAISGVLGAYFVWFPYNRVRLLFFLFPFFVDVFEAPARWVLGFYVVVQNVLPLLIAGGHGGVSYGAHLGGFFGGLALAFVWAQLDVRGADSAAAAAEVDAVLEQAREAIEDARPREALALLRHAIRRTPPGEPGRASLHLGVAQAYLALGQAPAAWQHLEQALAHDPAPEEEAAARELLAGLRAVMRVPRRFG